MFYGNSLRRTSIYSIGYTFFMIDCKSLMKNFFADCLYIVVTVCFCSCMLR